MNSVRTRVVLPPDEKPVFECLQPIAWPWVTKSHQQSAPHPLPTPTSHPVNACFPSMPCYLPVTVSDVWCTVSECEQCAQNWYLADTEEYLSSFDIALIFVLFLLYIKWALALAELPCEGWIKYIDLTPPKAASYKTSTCLPNFVLKSSAKV